MVNPVLIDMVKYVIQVEKKLHDTNFPIKNNFCVIIIPLVNKLDIIISYRKYEKT